MDRSDYLNWRTLGHDYLNDTGTPLRFNIKRIDAAMMELSNYHSKHINLAFNCSPGGDDLKAFVLRLTDRLASKIENKTKLWIPDPELDFTLTYTWEQDTPRKKWYFVRGGINCPRYNGIESYLNVDEQNYDLSAPPELRKICYDTDTIVREHALPLLKRDWP